ncbi:hypothetical protein FRC10_011938 [Ceratobasidium sp. 414]|nr:hypothetical protein FRC10_011938 [Ceratobasidium sp. 414]
MVIVIDALDECQDDEGVNRILGVLLGCTSELPVKFFITSRPSPAILNRMRSKWDEHVVFELCLHEVDHLAVQGDIRTYLMAKLGPANLSESEIANLVHRSGLLFGFSATIVDYLGHENFSQGTERLNHILAASVSSSNESTGVIDLLYTSIIREAFNTSALEPSKRGKMILMLHTIVCAQEPLTVEVLASLLKFDGASSVYSALLPLQSVLRVLHTSGRVITLYKSLPDYLLDQQRSGRFYCDEKKHHARLAQACFDLIAVSSPPFNICKLESSYLRDREIPNIAQRVKEAISAELLYACRYWGAHVELAGDPEDLLNRAHKFLATRLLLWMEVLNLNRCMGAGIIQLSRLRVRLKGIKGAAKIQDLAHDAWKFAVAFSSSPTSDRTPHIYVSTLPFWPEQLPVSKHYMPGMIAGVKATGSGIRTRKWAAFAVLHSADSVTCVAYAPDSAYVVSGSWGNTIRIWDAHTGQSVGQPPQGHKDTVSSVAYSPNGEYIVSGSSDKTIRIWDAYTGQSVGPPLEGHTDWVDSIAYSPNGEYIVSGSSDKTIRIWDAYTGQPVGMPLEGHTHSVHSVAYSPNGAYIASGSSDKTIRIWDVSTGQSVGHPLEGHTNSVHSVAYSPNGAYIVSGSSDNTIRVWDSHTRRSVGQPLEGHTDLVSSVAYSPNGAYIVSGSRDKTIRIWDTHTGQSAGQPLRGHTDWVLTVGCSHNGAYIMSGSSDKTIRIWDVRTGKSVGQPLKGHARSVHSVASSPNGAYIVSGSSDNTIRIWDAYTRRSVGQPLGGHSSFAYSVAYSPNGEYIVSGSSDETIRIWDAYTGQPVGQPLEGHTGSVNSVAYSPNGAYIVSGSGDRTVRIWDAHTGQSVGLPLKGHRDSVSSVAYSPNGAYIVSGSWDGTIRIWGARTGQSVGQPLIGHRYRNPVHSVAYSPNGAYIASGSSDKTILIWDAHTGRSVGQPLQGHTNSVHSVAYSPNGAYIVSGSRDKTIRIWDAHTGRPVDQPLEGHKHSVNAAAYSPDGAHIVSGSWDKTIRIWGTHQREILGPPAEVSLVHSVPSSESKHRLSRPVPSVPPNFKTVTDRVAEHRPHKVHKLPDDWTLDGLGWIVDAKQDRLIWVPHAMRDVLPIYPNTAVDFRYGSVSLDFRNAKLGDEWAQCFDSQQIPDVA